MTPRISTATLVQRGVAPFDYVKRALDQPELMARRIAVRFSGLLSALLNPLALTAYMLAAWRVTADIGWSSPFTINQGFFSHWMVWFSVGLALNACASVLNGRGASASGKEE